MSTSFVDGRESGLQNEPVAFFRGDEPMMFFAHVGRLVREGDGTLAIDCNDSGVIFVEASSPISLSELRDDKSCYTYENFFPLDCASFQEIGSLEADAPLFGAQVRVLPNVPLFGCG